MDEHLLERLELIFVPDAAADDDTLPWSGTQGSGDDRRHVVAPVEAEQASLNGDTVLSEPGYAHLDRAGYRLGIPAPGNPSRVEPYHQNPGCVVVPDEIENIKLLAQRPAEVTERRPGHWKGDLMCW